MDEIASKEAKIASKEIYLASSNPNGISHTYSEKNKEFIITVIGKCKSINAGYGNVTKDKIIEIVQWGETGLESINLSECTKLRKIASPSENSFNNMYASGFRSAFRGCTGLTEIPKDLFSNCPQVTSFRETFESCTSLTEIPTNLFSNCLNVEDFYKTFWWLYSFNR